MITDNIKILDCTLRDGGYYNKWDFDEKIVKRYLSSIKASSVDVVELGFRSIPNKNTFLGPYAYTTDEFLSQLDLPEGLMYGVMINGKEFLPGPNDHIPIKRYFQKKEESPVSLVRIAINFNQTLQVEPIAKILKEMGYMVGLNMMQANGKSEKEYFEIAKEISTWNVIDVLYFADSLGNMYPNDVLKICKEIKKGWDGSLGIHTHNNKSLALINSITAIKNGVTWCDATITGMGRGAGNAPTESLIIEMSHMGYHNGSVTMIQPTVDDFTKLKNKYDWGPNLYYHYASNHRIHPTFVQSLLDDRRYNGNNILDALQFLSSRESSNYSDDAMLEAIYGNQEELIGEWDATNWLEKEEVLLVGAGNSIKKYRKGILQYINKKKPTVLFLNINPFLPIKIATATIVSHITSALFDSKKYQELKHPVVLPKARLGDLIKTQLQGVEILDYGLSLKHGQFDILPNGCKLQWSLAAAYALAVVTQASASKISLVGFDGYDVDDPKQEEMNDVFLKYSLHEKSIPITALTPTTYRVKQSSIFSPIIS